MMKKILSAEKIREADAYTIAHEPVSSLLLMERAAHACFQWVRNEYDTSHDIKIFCGTGNNGGDGLVMTDYLFTQRSNVNLYIVRYSENSSPDFLSNENRLEKNFPEKIINIHTEKDFPLINKNDVVIDSLFGTGLNKQPAGLAAKVIHHINNSGAEVVAVDMPSGLFADRSSTEHSDVIINAKHTLTFQLKKLAFYFPENAKFFGNVHVMDIKLHKDFIENCETGFYEIDSEDVQHIIQPRNEFAHKGNYGHALLMCGSFGKIGAAVLAAEACMRSGAGLLTVNIPFCGYSILQSTVPVAMTIADENEKFLSKKIDYSIFSAIGVGPGIGTEKITADLLSQLFETYKKPLVIDADALNIISQNKNLLKKISPQSILTPHLKEFERLTEKAENDFHRNELQRNFSQKNNCFVVLKGKYSCISTPGGVCYFNPTGNPGMATGGAGDVLTGILTGLLAQGYSSLNSCIAGVFIHGLAGDIAAGKKSMFAMIATDIIENIGDAWLQPG